MTKLQSVFYILLFFFRICSADLLPSSCFGHPRVTIASDYDPSVPPIVDNSSEVLISTLATIPEIMSIDDFKQEIKLPVYTTYFWEDSRINLTENVSDVTLSKKFFLNCIWSPNLSHFALSDVTVLDGVKHPFSFKIYRDPDDGRIYIGKVVFLIVTINCVMDFDWYPFDQQACLFMETSMDYETFKMNISGDLIYLEGWQRVLQYDISMEKVRGEALRGGSLGQEMYASAWILKLSRRIRIHVLETFFPTATYVSISWLSFLIKPDVVPGRMALLITTLLVMVNVFLRVSEDTPMTKNVTAVSLWIIMCIMMIVAAITEYGIILFYMRKNNGVNEKEKARKGNKCQGKIRKIDQYSFVLFPIICILCFITYWIICYPRLLDKFIQEESKFIRELREDSEFKPGAMLNEKYYVK